MDTPTPRLHDALARWLLDEQATDEVPVVADTEPSGVALMQPWPAAAVLYELWDDPTPLPTQVRDRLQVPVGATFAHVARLVWSICDEVDFPALTHADAVRHLADEDEETVHAYHRTIDQRLREGADAEPVPSLREVAEVVHSLAS